MIEDYWSVKLDRRFRYGNSEITQLRSAFSPYYFQNYRARFPFRSAI